MAAYNLWERPAGIRLNQASFIVSTRPSNQQKIHFLCIIARDSVAAVYDSVVEIVRVKVWSGGVGRRGRVRE